MSSEIRISLNNIRNVKKVYIEGIGGFTVRKLGAGEELDLSEKLRRLSIILKELQSIDFTKYDATTKEGIKDLEKISERADKLTEEVDQIQRFELETYKRCFEDDNDGKNVEILLNTLSTQERSNLFNKIFKPVAVVEAPETVKDAKVEEPAKPEEKRAEKASKEVDKNG